MATFDLGCAQNAGLIAPKRLRDSRPTLRRMAHNYLATQGPAMPGERAFSSGSLTGTKLRKFDADFGYLAGDEAEDSDIDV